MLFAVLMSRRILLKGDEKSNKSGGFNGIEAIYAISFPKEIYFYHLWFPLKENEYCPFPARQRKLNLKLDTQEMRSQYVGIIFRCVKCSRDN